jgi:hypothetical protein
MRHERVTALDDDLASQVEAQLVHAVAASTRRHGSANTVCHATK